MFFAYTLVLQCVCDKRNWKENYFEIIEAFYGKEYGFLVEVIFFLLLLDSKVFSFLLLLLLNSLHKCTAPTSWIHTNTPQSYLTPPKSIDWFFSVYNFVCLFEEIEIESINITTKCRRINFLCVAFSSFLVLSLLVVIFILYRLWHNGFSFEMLIIR